ncbi:MAG TPA: exodeoxyribonuclease VII small subunit [Bacteroidota bacterium]|nr:exodeoxyribonuclease VII small subunit [Bacteroidota bacterium]
MSAKKNPKQTFEESLKRLEKIVEILEQGEISLDEAIELYEEGIELSKFCGEKLKTVELKLKKLSKNLNGEFEITDLETE